MKNLMMLLLITLPLMAFGNGSDTGHHNGNHEHGDSIVINSQDTVVDNDLSVENSVRVDSDSSAGAYAEGQSHSDATGGSGQGTASIGAITLGDRNKYPASRAATVYSQVCQSGMSGQTRSGGFGISNPDQFCDHLRMADVAWQAYQRTLNNPGTCETITAEVTCDEPGHVLCEVENCQSVDSEKYLTMYHTNLDDANALLTNTKAVSLWDRIAGYLVKPGSIFALLILGL